MALECNKPIGLFSLARIARAVGLGEAPMRVAPSLQVPTNIITDSGRLSTGKSDFSG